jgi:hypothetical protein
LFFLESELEGSESEPEADEEDPAPGSFIYIFASVNSDITVTRSDSAL